MGIGPTSLRNVISGDRKPSASFIERFEIVERGGTMEGVEDDQASARTDLSKEAEGLARLILQRARANKRHTVGHVLSQLAEIDDEFADALELGFGEQRNRKSGSTVFGAPGRPECSKW